MDTTVIKNIARYLQAKYDNVEVSEVNEISEKARTEAQEWYNQCKHGIDDNPAMYIGTYKKYNEGSLFGMWIDLSSFSDVDEFYEFCRALHSDEDDPEFMAQDYENFSDNLYYESPDRDSVEKIIEFANMDEDDKELLEAFIDATGNKDATLEDARDRLAGQAESDEEFAENVLSEDGTIDQLDSIIRNNIDWEGVARDLMNEYYEANGYYFRAN